MVVEEDSDVSICTRQSKMEMLNNGTGSDPLCIAVVTEAYIECNWEFDAQPLCGVGQDDYTHYFHKN